MSVFCCLFCQPFRGDPVMSSSGVSFPGQQGCSSHCLGTGSTPCLQGPRVGELAPPLHSADVRTSLMYEGSHHPTCSNPQAPGPVRLTIHLQAGQCGVDSQHLSQGGPAGAEGDVADARVTLGEWWVPATEKQCTVVAWGPEEDALSFLQVLCPGCQQVLNFLGRKRHYGVLNMLRGTGSSGTGTDPGQSSLNWALSPSRAHTPLCPPTAVWCHPTEPATAMTHYREPRAVVQPHLEQRCLVVTPQGGSGRPGCRAWGLGVPESLGCAPPRSHCVAVEGLVLLHLGAVERGEHEQQGPRRGEEVRWCSWDPRGLVAAPGALKINISLAQQLGLASSQTKTRRCGSPGCGRRCDGGVGRGQPPKA